MPEPSSVGRYPVSRRTALSGGGGPAIAADLSIAAPATSTGAGRRGALLCGEPGDSATAQGV